MKCVYTVVVVIISAMRRRVREYALDGGLDGLYTRADGTVAFSAAGEKLSLCIFCSPRFSRSDRTRYSPARKRNAGDSADYKNDRGKHKGVYALSKCAHATLACTSRYAILLRYYRCRCAIAVAADSVQSRSAAVIRRRVQLQLVVYTHDTTR